MNIERGFVLDSQNNCDIILQKIKGFWHIKKSNSRNLTIVEPLQVIDFIKKKAFIIDNDDSIISFYGLNANPKTLQEVISIMYKEEIDRVKNDLEYFIKTYTKAI